ncbi:putative Kinase superfamily protein [Hibiscus syriacus]|uniref:Kinase superfamily protein n=1 Tax=Hibiscus syriacus TaxID=106335 RepID=A0A6A3AN86_HIBSY|nr:putative Kinase superfamily protein [Hibiscus syriacus]
MEDKVHQPLILLLFLVFFSSFQLPSSAYTLPDKYFINCGSNINLNIASRTYVGDMNSRLVSFTKQKSIVFDNKQASKTPSDLYRTARTFGQKSSYVLEIDSKGSYLVRLHFFSSMSLSAAVFDVSASGSVLLHNFPVQNSNNTAVIKEFILSIPIGDFSINFVPQGSSFAYVNAIEVFPAPPDFINDEASNGNKGIRSQALHTIHRINVGGTTLTPQNDTLLRTWLPDDDYLHNPQNAKNNHVLAGQPNYLAPVNKFIAPAPVYMTAKEMNIESNNFNITWSYEKINPYKITGQLVTPFYVDFVVDSDDSGFMNISIGPDSSSSMQTAFLNGVEIMEMVGVSAFATVSVKPKQKSAFVIIGLVLGGLVLVCTFGGLLCIRLKCRKSKSVETPKWPPLTAYKESTHSNRKMSQQSKLSREGTASASPVPDLNLGLKIPLFEIQLATSNFDTKLLIGSGQGLPEFQTEIMVLSRIHHLHLVSLIGYCDEMSEMVLVGLNYLHKGATGGIIHRDVKSTNILLDGNLVAKVADFGLSRSGPPDQSHVSTDVKGTFGYLDPDYFRTQQLTEKSDVYSFGVVLLEVLCARPAIDPTLPRDQVSLAEWGILCKKKELLEQIIDPSIKLQINPNSLRKFADIVERCLEEDAGDRPTMSDVAWDLEYALQLQQTAVVQQPHEDSTSNVSAMLLASVVQCLPSMTAQFHSNDKSIIREDDSDSVPSASEVFSQLRINDAR